MNRALFALVPLLALSALAACQTKPIQQMSYSELVATANQIDKRCADQGAGPGTRNYQICFKQEADREVYTRAANREAMVRVGRGLAAAGRAAQANQPVTCTSNRFGTMTTTTCN